MQEAINRANDVARGRPVPIGVFHGTPPFTCTASIFTSHHGPFNKMKNYYLLRSGHKEFFPYWDDEDAVSVGWSSEAEKIVKGSSWNDARRRIDEKYPTDNPGDATGEIFCFAGREGKSRPPMSEDDIVIVVGKREIKGEPVLRAVAKVEEVDIRGQPVSEDYQHTVHRGVKDWLYNEGPVSRRELDDRFRKGGEGSTWFRGTLKQWKPDRKNNANTNSLLEDLVDELHAAPSIQPKQYDFDYTEPVVQDHISDHPEEFSKGTGVDHEKLAPEQPTAGRKRADFLALEGNESVTVIETKVGTAGPSAVKQLKGYMQDVADDYRGDVRGVLVAEDFVAFGDMADEIGDHDIELKRYHVTLEYEDVEFQ